VAFRAVASLIAVTALPLSSGYAADFNQNLSIWQASERARQEMVAQAPPSVALAPGATVSAPAKPGTKAAKELPKGLKEAAPSEAVSKLLSPSVDPSVPLPQAGLTRQGTSGDDGGDSPLAGPRVYGRPEQGNNGVMGLVMGVKIPIPADRSAALPHTTSGTGSSGSESSDSAR